MVVQFDFLGGAEPHYAMELDQKNATHFATAYGEAAGPAACLFTKAQTWPWLLLAEEDLCAPNPAS